MKYRIVRFYSLPCKCYRFKVQKKILWWWKDQAFEKSEIASFMDFKNIDSAEAHLAEWLLTEGKPVVVKYLQINEKYSKNT